MKVKQCDYCRKELPKGPPVAIIDDSCHPVPVESEFCSSACSKAHLSAGGEPYRLKRISAGVELIEPLADPE